MSNRAVVVAFSPLGRTIAVAGNSGRAGLLDIHTGRTVDLFNVQVNLVPFAMAFGAEDTCWQWLSAMRSTSFVRKRKLNQRPAASARGTDPQAGGQPG